MPQLYGIPLPGPGRLSTMARPSGGEHLHEEMAALRAVGVDVLVSLLEAEERDRLGLGDEPAAAVRAGLEYREHGIVDFGVPRVADIAPVLDGIQAALREGRHVVVHCHGGVGRSSLVAGAVLVRLGVPVDEAWRRIGSARGVPVPETDEQRRWLSGLPA